MRTGAFEQADDKSLSGGPSERVRLHNAAEIVNFYS